MKLFVLASLVALCAATPYFGAKTVLVNNDDDITIQTTEGIQVLFTRQDVNGHILNVVVNGPSASAKLYKIIDNTWYNTNADEDVLANILRQCQGIVDKITFEKLVYRIEKAVEMGLVSHHVYKIFTVLNKFDVDVVMQQQILEAILEECSVQSGIYSGNSLLAGNPLMGAIYGSQDVMPYQLMKQQINQGQLNDFVRLHVNNEVQQLVEEELLKEKMQPAGLLAGKQISGLGQWNKMFSSPLNTQFGYQNPRGIVGQSGMWKQGLFGRQIQGRLNNDLTAFVY